MLKKGKAMKIQNPTLQGGELDRVLDYDTALAHFFKMRGLSKDGQEAFNAVVGNYPNMLYGIKEAFGLLDREHDTKVPRYLNEKPVSVHIGSFYGSAVDFLEKTKKEYETFKRYRARAHESDASELMMYQDLVPGLTAAVLMIKNEGEREKEKDNGNYNGEA